MTLLRVSSTLTWSLRTSPISPVLAGVAAVVLLLSGLAMLPYFAWRQKRFLVENTRYGRTP